ncbi:MAG: hypothetical protein QXH12_02010 [Candidatus Caldarchaeum sp.]|uniref:Uncharacterized protein n=1 Tax=Caldiarchaeum subterraneum TaxID=311458 RepID=A0A7C5QCJ2_CALS0
MKRVKLVHGRREIDVVLSEAGSAKFFSSRLTAQIAGAFHEPDYPARVAESLGVSKQVVGLYVRKMCKAGLLTEVGEVEVRGGRARLYRTTASGLAVVFPKHPWRRLSKMADMPGKLSAFLHPFVKDGKLNGLVVVGSPHPHGPFRSVAADGHYGFQLGLFLGRYVELPADFAVRLDVDVKSEKLHENNMLLLGGPGTNIITASVNSSLPIRFIENNYWAGLVSPKQKYASEFTGIVAKTPNPSNPDNIVIVLAGLRASGTKAAVISLTTRWEKLLQSYEGQDSWAAVVEGLDLDGDGKIDSVEILETT